MKRIVEGIEHASITESSGAWLALSMGVSGETQRKRLWFTIVTYGK